MIEIPSFKFRNSSLISMVSHYVCACTGLEISLKRIPLRLPQVFAGSLNTYLFLHKAPLRSF